MALGDKFIDKNGCPKCGKDTTGIEGVVVWCTSYGYEVPTKDQINDEITCGYFLLSG